MAALPPGQLGRIFENLVENTYTAAGGGRIASYLPVLDSRGVDRAVSIDGGPPLFLQIKGHEHPRRDGRLSFEIPLSQVGAYHGWYAVLVGGSAARLDHVYLVSGRDLLEHGERGHLVDGRACVHVTLSPASPTWSHTVVAPPEALARRLVELGRAGLGLSRVFDERQQEEGAFFEAAITAQLLAGSDRLILYRPAVDFAGRDLLLQLAGTARHLFIQVKGTGRQDVSDHVRFQVRRRTLVNDPRLVFLFAYSGRPGEIGPIWCVDAIQLQQLSAAGDDAHISFEARISGADRWASYRIDPTPVADALLPRLAGEASSSGAAFRPRP